MKFPFRSQAGFAAIEIVIVILLLSAISVAGYFAFSAKQKSEINTTPISVPPVRSSPTPDPYKDWKTYTSRCASMSFKYPSDWTVTAQSGDYKQFDPCNPVPVNITSPSGNILAWVPWVYGDGPGCFIIQNECPTITTIITEAGPIAGTKLVKRVACNFEDPTKCEGQIILAKPDSNNKLTFEVGKRQEYPVATFMSTSGKYTAFFMTQSRSTPWGNSPGVNGKYSEEVARAWLTSADAKDAVLSIQSLK